MAMHYIGSARGSAAAFPDVELTETDRA